MGQEQAQTRRREERSVDSSGEGSKSHNRPCTSHCYIVSCTAARCRCTEGHGTVNIMSDDEDLEIELDDNEVSDHCSLAPHSRCLS